jgi:hypothetical protein
MSSRRTMKSVIIALSCMAAAGCESRARSASSDTAQPAAAPWQLVEDLRIGDADEGPGSFADIRGVAITQTGNVFVLDYKAMELRVFSASGAFLRTAARKGNGPGEMDFPNGVVVGDDDVVRLSDPGNGRFSTYTAVGEYVGQITSAIRGFGDIWGGVVDPSGRVLDFPVRVPTGRTDPRTNYPETVDHIRRIRSDGHADTLPLPACAPEPPTLVYQMRSGHATSMGMPYAASAIRVATRKGTVWCTPASDYRLFAGSVGEPLKEVVRLSTQPIPLSAEERRKARGLLDDFAREQDVKLVSGDPEAMPVNKPVISRMFADDQGRAWVQRADVAGVATAVDVFDTSGRAVATIRTNAPLGHLNVVSGNKLVTVLRNADDVPIVVRYQINR